MRASQVAGDVVTAPSPRTVCSIGRYYCWVITEAGTPFTSPNEKIGWLRGGQLLDRYGQMLVVGSRCRRDDRQVKFRPNETIRGKAL